jgi:hypothetical protein
MNSNGGGEEENDALVMNEADENELGIASHRLEQDCQLASNILNPQFTSDVGKTVSTLQSHHWYLTLLFAGATIAFWVTVGVVPALGVDRLLPVTINVVAPPVNSTTNNTFIDAFHTQTMQVSGIPLTVLLSSAATWQFIYHALHSVVYKSWIRNYVNAQHNPYRWFFAAGTKTLSFIVLFALNGEHELTSFLFLAGAVAGICFLGHALDEAVAWACTSTKQGKGDSNHRLFGASANIVNYGRAFFMVSAVLAVAFVIRLSYNHGATPHWVRALSIALIIYESMSVVVYVYSTYQNKCDKNNNARFAKGDYRFMASTFLSFVALSVTVFVGQNGL